MTCFCIINLLLFSISNIASASLITIDVTEDAFVNSGNSNTNYGSASLLRVGRSDRANLNLGAGFG